MKGRASRGPTIPGFTETQPVNHLQTSHPVNPVTGNQVRGNQVRDNRDTDNPTKVNLGMASRDTASPVMGNPTKVNLGMASPDMASRDTASPAMGNPTKVNLGMASPAMAATGIPYIGQTPKTPIWRWD